MPHFSAMEALKIVLVVLVVLGAGRFLAMAHPDNTIAQAFLTLY